MPFRTLCILVVVVAGPFGLAFLCVPDWLAGLYGINGFNAGTLVTARLYGVALLFTAVAAYVVHDTDDLRIQQRATSGNGLVSALGVLVSLQSVLAGTSNALMWTTVALYGFFCGAFLLLRLRLQPGQLAA